MASVAHFLFDLENIFDCIEFRLELAEQNATKNFVCARSVQKIFRGYITRKHVQLLHLKATCIQKNWKGFKGRMIYRARLKEKFDEICYAHYNKNATIIQKCWKGYWIRSKVFSYYRLKDWLAFVMQQNKLLKLLIERCHSKNDSFEMKQRETEAKQWIIYILYKLHHLLRTRQISGIYSLPNTTDLSNIEKMLKCLKYKDFMVFYNAYMQEVREKEAKILPQYILQQCKYPGHYEREYYEQKQRQTVYLNSKTSYINTGEIADMEIREKTKCQNLTK